MIRFTWYELLWLFFIYSFLGWVLETAAATVKQKKICEQRFGEWTVLCDLRYRPLCS